MRNRAQHATLSGTLAGQRDRRESASARRLTAVAAAAFTAAVLLASLGAAAARANWTTYRADAARSGVDHTSIGSVPITPAWQSPPTLAGLVYAQPLVYNGLVVVGTESDDVYALDEASGQIVWHANPCTGASSTCQPQPATSITCGDITPTIGITSTPVIDGSSGTLYVVADLWDGSHAHHWLLAYDVRTGTELWRESVDPAGATPEYQLNRTALALAGGMVVVGFGGNSSDCGIYHGWLVAVPESGPAPLKVFEAEGQPDGSHGGAIWGSGDGAAVDSSGDVWVATGNGFGSSFGYQESVIKLDSDLNLLDSWTPANWATLDSTDSDIGSAEPLLLPGGLVFQIGKGGLGYLLAASSLGGQGASPVFQAQVCGTNEDASFGGGIYYAGIIYVSCADGLRALSLNTTTRTFAAVPGWQPIAQAIGAPIVSGGLVWVTGWSTRTLYGLDPQTGQAVVTQTTPAMEHFTAPAASNGKVFLATGPTVEAYNVANAVQPPSLTMSFGSGSVPVGGSTSLTFNIVNPNVSTPLTGISFSDALPAGLALAADPSAANGCGGALVADAGGSSVSLTGGSLGAGSSCSISVTVTGQTAGSQSSTTSPIDSNEGDVGGSASASLNVEAPPQISMQFMPAQVTLGHQSQLSLTITNPSGNPDALTGVGFFDRLPDGLTVASSFIAACGGAVKTIAPDLIGMFGATVTTDTPCQVSLTVTGGTPGMNQNSTGAVSSSNGGTGNSASASLVVIGRPTISIRTPAAGAHYGFAQRVAASYSCAEDPNGPGLRSCRGPVASGRPIPTTAPGRHHFTVIATSKDGESVSKTITYTVALPSNRFRTLHISPHRDGHVDVELKVPNPGRIEILGTAPKSNLADGRPEPGKLVYAHSHATVSRGGAVRLAVAPGRDGQRLLRHHRQSVRITLWITYTPNAGKPRKVGINGVQIPG